MNKAGLGLRFPALAIEKIARTGHGTFLAQPAQVHSWRNLRRRVRLLQLNKAGLGLRFPALAIEKNRKNGARSSIGETDAGFTGW